MGNSLIARPAAAAAASAGATAAADAASPIVARPRIVITSRRHEVNDQALAALAAGAELFELRGTLVELVRYPHAAAVVRVRGPRLEELLSRHCEFVRVAADGDAREVAPPRWTVRALLARGRWPELPQLEAGPESRASGAGFGPSSRPDGLGQRLELSARVSGAGPESRAIGAGFGPSSSQDGLGQEVELQAFLEALEPVLEALGGAATSRRIAGALAAEPGRFAAFAAAFDRLVPGLEPGDPQAPAALGYRLRTLKNRPGGGRVLVEQGRTRGGIAWALHAALSSNDLNPRRKVA